MSNWNARLKLKMKELGLTQEELANQLGVTRSAVAHYVQGTRHPPLKQFVKLASVLKTDPSWLQFGKSQPSTHSAGTKRESNRIPILDWHEVLSFNSNAQRSKYNKQDYLNYFGGIQEGYFALLVKGDAMITSSGHAVSFTPGSFLIIDQNKPVVHGSYVIANSGNKKEAIFRQYIEEGGTKYLKPLNSQYPLMKLERDIKILGVVVANIQITE